jgi:LCP family protein required for cell wall assembly
VSPRRSKSSRPARSFRRSFTHRFVIACVVVLALVIAGVIAGNEAVDHELAQLPRTKVTALADDHQAQGGNFLIVGSDSRQFVDSAAQAQAFGSPTQETGQRSDTLMVLHIDPTTKKALLVSFPRDLMVNIPGIGYSKINAAFNDGPDKVIETLKDNFNVDIQHYVEVSFDTFPKVVDAIGTVPVYFPTPARDLYTGLSVTQAGCVDLDGQSALAYVRSRHYEVPDASDPTQFHEQTGSDIQRIARQQNFLRRLATIAAHKSSSDFLKALDLADAVVPNLKVDTNLSRSDINSLIHVFLGVDPNNPQDLEMVTIPWEQQGDQLVPKQPDANLVAARLAAYGSNAAAAERAVAAQLNPSTTTSTTTGGQQSTKKGSGSTAPAAPTC